MLTYVQGISENTLGAQKELDDRFCRAMNAKDVEGAMSCLWNHQDLVLVLWGNVLRGPEAARAALSRMFAEHSAVALDINEVTHIPAGDAVIAVGTATYHLRSTSGEEQTLVERWTDLRRQIDGRWVYVLDHATVVPE